jgi:putative endonuclease
MFEDAIHPRSRFLGSGAARRLGMTWGLAVARRDHTYYVYIVASWTRAIYTGVTNNVEVRLHQHRAASADSFAGKYRTHRLVYVEEYRWIHDAIAREKQIKGWRRDRKIALIEALNPDWKDLSEEWV